nr:hypothetical protein [uncultured Acetatifactor sp.]
MNKFEQLFVLGIGCVSMLGLLCLSGCTGCSIEMPQCGGINEEGGRFVGVSVPGCGGCLSSGKGCGSCLWSQAVKFFAGCIEDTGSTGETYTYLGCDNEYYGGCCGRDEGACYGGFMVQDIENWGIVWGDYSGGGEQKEHLLGVADGCAGCFTTEPETKSKIDDIEGYLGID